MSEKELLYQVLNREIGNFLGNINPAFRMFSTNVTTYIINFIEPYINAFTNSDGHFNSKAAEGFLKQEVNEKINSFMEKFEAENGNSSKL